MNSMFRRFALGAFCSATFFLSSALAAGDAEGRALFDGKSLDGWTIQNGGHFSVENGLIKLDRGTGWLRSNETFGDCVIEIEFRFLEEKANSGIFVRTGPTSHDDEKGYPDNGYQIQCADLLDGQYPIGSVIPYGAPAFDTDQDLDATKRAYKPAGEWQRYEIVCLGESMRITLNGVVVTYASNVRNLSGHIGLQGEGFPLEFRSVTVKPL